MDNPFTSYDWTGVTLLRTQYTRPHTAGVTYTQEKPDRFYQLGLKHHGKTDVLYNGKYYKYHDFTVLYLPHEKCDSINYSRTIVEIGDGACVFFNSEFELPSEPFTMSCKGSARVVELFYRLAQLNPGRVIGTKQESERRLEALSVFYKLLLELSETYSQSESSSTLHARLKPAVDFISQNTSAEYIDLSQLAGLCGMSADYFRHSFRRAFGISPLGYINRAKLEYSKQLLLSGASVGDAARLSGFSSANYFTRVFREQLGVTPSRFAEGNRLGLM